MARNWQGVRAEAIATGRLDEARIAEHRRPLRDQVRAYRLAQVQEASGRNQTDVAQRWVCRSLADRAGDMKRAEIATVLAYVGALSGEAEIVARFGDERFTIA